jgi:ACR3 family arsenite efflux pump ArsB
LKTVNEAAELYKGFIMLYPHLAQIRWKLIKWIFSEKQMKKRYFLLTRNLKFQPLRTTLCFVKY